MKLHYVPLGTRCSSAFIIKEHLIKREESLPLDWLAMDLSAVEKFVKVLPENAESFIDEYFDDMESRNAHKHSDGTYFPHDIHMVGTAWRLLPDAREKYKRRLVRFSNLLRSGDGFVFLTVMIDKGFQGTSDFIPTYKFLQDLTNNKCVFVSINMGGSVGENHFNFDVEQIGPDDFGLKGWESLCAKAIVESESLYNAITKLENSDTK